MSEHIFLVMRADLWFGDDTSQETTVNSKQPWSVEKLILPAKQMWNAFPNKYTF